MCECAVVCLADDSIGFENIIFAVLFNAASEPEMARFTFKGTLHFFWK